jgi:hypothetical protein
MDVKPLFFFLWEKNKFVVSLLVVGECFSFSYLVGKKRERKRRRHWGINFLFPNHENGASAVVSDFSMSLALHTNAAVTLLDE